MTVEPLYLLTDEPIGHHEDDALGMRHYADVIAGASTSISLASPTPPSLIITDAGRAELRNQRPELNTLG